VEEVFEFAAAVEVQTELSYFFDFAGTEIGLHCFLCFGLLRVALDLQLTEKR